MKIVETIKLKLREMSLNEKILASILLGLFIWLTYYNITTAYFIIDSDVVVDNILIPKIVSERGLFGNDFIFGHESMFSRPFIITMFIKLFVSDWILAAKLGVSVTTFLIIALFYTLCRRVNLSRSAALISIIFLLSVNVSIFNNFRAANFYPTFVIIPLLTCILIIDLKKSGYSLKSTANKLKIAALGVIALLSGFFGIRMMAVLFIPLVVVEFFHAAGNVRGEKANIAPLLRQRGFITAVALFLINALGLMLLETYNYYNEIFSPAGIGIRSVNDIFEILIPAARSSLLDTLCIPAHGIGLDNIPLLAEVALRVVILALCLFGIFYIVKKRRFYPDKFAEKTEKPRTYATYAMDYFLIANIVVAAIMIVIGQLSPKYFYFIWYLVAFAVACISDRVIIKTSLYRRFFAVIAAMLCIVSVYNNDWKDVKDAHERDREQITHYKVAEYLKNNGYECVYGNFWNSALISAYTNLEVGAGYLNADSFNAEMWAADKRVYYNNDRGKYALVMTESEMQTAMTHTPKYKQDFLAQEAVFVTGIDHLNIYETGINPLAAFRFPKSKGDASVYDFSKNYAAKSDETLISYKDGYVESDTPGPIAWGPYIKMYKGKYELTVKYEYLEEPSSASISLTHSFGSYVMSEFLPQGTNTATFTVELTENHEAVEIKADNSNGKVRIYSVIVTKVK